MARQFASVSSQYLKETSAVLSGVPISMACWFYGDSDNDNCLMCISDISDDKNYFVLFARNSAVSWVVNAQTRWTGNWGTAEATTTWSTGQWHHVCGVFGATDSRAVYLDGGNKGTDITDGTPTGLDTTGIGALLRNPLGLYVDGREADAAIWNVALSDADAAILALGFSPLMVKPANLVAYWPLIRDDRDWVGGYDMTAYNSPTWAAHAGKVQYPLWRPSLLKPGAAGLLLRRGVLRGIARGILRGV